MIKPILTGFLVFVLSACDKGEVCISTVSSSTCQDPPSVPSELAGTYDFFSTDLNYNDGTTRRYDGSSTAGTFAIRGDGTYSQIIVYAGDTTRIAGTFESIKATADHKWTVVSVYGAEKETEEMEIRGDTLLQTTVVPKSGGPDSVGYTEVDRMLRLIAR